MAVDRSITSHPAWEDGVEFGLGVLIVLTPMLTSDQVDKTVQFATTFIGLLTLISAFIERMQILELAQEPSREWEEVLQCMLGATLIALPFIFGYANAGTLRYWHFALGAIVFMLAIIELRRDYVSDVARRGEPQTIDASTWGNVAAVGASMLLPLAVVIAASLL